MVTCANPHRNRENEIVTRANRHRNRDSEIVTPKLGFCNYDRTLRVMEILSPHLRCKYCSRNKGLGTSAMRLYAPCIGLNFMPETPTCSLAKTIANVTTYNNWVDKLYLMGAIGLCCKRKTERRMTNRMFVG